MKVIVDEVVGEGLISMLGKNVTLMCLNYTYAGKLVGVNAEDVKLEDPGIVFETGPFDNTAWKDFQKLPHKHFYVRVSAIESYGVLK